MNNLTIISDPGVDDLVALVLLDKITKKQPKTLVSTYGNNKANITNENAKSFASFMGKNWSHREGATMPLNGTVNNRWLDSSQGTDGLWGCRPTSMKKVTTDEVGESSKIISLAPLTEVYKIMQKQKILELTVMGGLFISVNKKKVAEFNIQLDTMAAKQVFERCNGTDVTVIPADVADSVYWTEKKILSIPESGETNKWLKRLLLSGYRSGRYCTNNDFILFDPLAVYLEYNPVAANWKRCGVSVIDDDGNYGCTEFSDNNPPCNIATGLKKPDEVAQEIFSTLFEDNIDDN